MSDAHAHAVQGAHEGDHGHGDIDSHIRKAFVVFGALLVLTALTVGVSYLHVSTGKAIALALFIATVKGTLVTLWFMHLISERKLVFAVLAITVAFFFTLLLIPYWTSEDIPKLQAPASGASKGAFTQDQAAGLPAAHGVQPDDVRHAAPDAAPAAPGGPDPVPAVAAPAGEANTPPGEAPPTTPAAPPSPGH